MLHYGSSSSLPVSHCRAEVTTGWLAACSMEPGQEKRSVGISGVCRSKPVLPAPALPCSGALADRFLWLSEAG